MIYATAELGQREAEKKKHKYTKKGPRFTHRAICREHLRQAER